MGKGRVNAAPPQSPPRAVVFVGGGTGGHLYPALAVAEQIRGLGVDRCVFCASDRAIDAAVLEADVQAPDAWLAMPARPPRASVRGGAGFVASWGKTVRAARSAIRAAAEGVGVTPSELAVVSTGGFVSGPCVQAAAVERCRVWMLNLDAVPGKANRWLVARRAHAVLDAAPALAEHLPEELAAARSGWTGVPPVVRPSFLQSGDAATSRAGFGLDPNRDTLLITGGSQGARTLADLMVSIAYTRPAWLAGWQVLHQAPADMIGALEIAYRSAEVPAECMAFISDMPAALSAASLAIGRGGAGTVSELWATRTPGVVLPYPWHKDRHQAYNAATLVASGGAVVVDDAIDAERTIEAAAGTLERVLRDRERLSGMRRAMGSLPVADGARRAAERIACAPEAEGSVR